jgi:hypothetical protein
MSDYSAILKKYVINNGTYVDKKMEPLATKEDLNNFKTTWMFPGLKVVVLSDEDGEMREYQCKLVDGEKIWVSCQSVTESHLEDLKQDIEENNKKVNESISAIESIYNIQGEDIEI